MEKAILPGFISDEWNRTRVNIFYTVSLVIERLNIIFATTFGKYEK